MADDEKQPEAFRLAGDRLGKFVILQELGRGAMGVVYEAFQEDLRRKVALKILPANITLDAKQVQRFRREAESAARLRHDNIIAIYEVGEIDGTHYFAMELVDGRPFSAFVSRDAESMEAAVRVARDAARGLAHAHERGVIHRDVKPGNILVAKDGRTVVTDFGLARLSESASLTSTDAIVGTPKYMSPEQILPRGEPIDGRGDVYSLGATLYEIVAGRPPILAPSVQAFIKAVLDEPAPSPRKFNRAVPHELATILLRCLEKDPKDRYASAAALADDLDRLRRGERILARPKTFAARGVTLVRRHRVLTALAIVSVVAVGALLVTMQLAKDRDFQVELGRIAAERDLTRAVDRAEELWRANPGRAEVAEARARAYGNRARARNESGDLEGARGDWEACGAPDPFWYPLVLVELNELEAARRIAEARPKDDAGAALTRARIALVEKRYLEAIDLLEPALQRDPHPLALLTVGLAWRGDGNRDEAFRALKLANERGDDVRESWVRAKIEYWWNDARARKNPEIAAAFTLVGGAAREALKDLSTFWAGMTRRQASHVEEYVSVVLALAGRPPGTLVAVLKADAERQLSAAATPAERVKGKLLLAVALQNGGERAAAKDALDEAAMAGDETLMPYVLWGLSLLARAEDDVRQAVDNAIDAVEAAETVAGCPELRRLVRNGAFLGEEALDRGELDAARRAAGYLEQFVAKHRELADACAELLRRVRAS